MALPGVLARVVMIQLAVILVAVAVVWDLALVALADVAHDRNRIDRRWKR